MSPIVVGYSVPISYSRDVACSLLQSFRDRARSLGLTISLDMDRHAVAVNAPAVRARCAAHDRWRVIHVDAALHRRASLAMHGIRPDVMSDGEAIETLLGARGPAALSLLVGDWAVVAVSDEGLLLATDYFGNRALFYHVDDDGGVTWSNRDWPLAAFADHLDVLDPTYFAGLLYFLPPPDRTPFREIRAIPAGYLGLLGSHRLDVRPYWNPQQRRIQLANSEEYAQTFLGLLREAVRDRLSVPGRKWVEISGGVDSALVAACASACVRENDDLGPLEAVHYTTDRPEGAGDTRRAREAANQYGLPLRTFSLETLFQRSATVPIEDPREPLGVFREVPRIAHESGVSVLLSGRLGDLVTGNREPEAGLLLDLMNREGLSTALRALYDWAVFAETPVWHLLASLVRDRMFSTREAKLLHSFTERTRQKSCVDQSSPGPPGRLAVALDEAVQSWHGFLNWPGRDALDYVDVWWWFAIHTMRMSGAYRSSWDASACDRTYPLSHRPLLDFLVASPWTVFLGPSQPRRLVHEQLGHLLPRSLVGNVLKSDTATWRISLVRDLWAATLPLSSETSLVRAGLLLPEDIDRLGTALRTNRGSTMALFPRVLQTELWLRSRPRQLVATHPIHKGGDSYALRNA
jgi:Asparagine synthase